MASVTLTRETGRDGGWAANPAINPHEYVCWTRMQSEAGQGLEAIVGRKELERRAGDGVFAWGVGNAPALLASRLARTGVRVPVVFSVMKSKPKAVDAAPARTFAWRRYIDATGKERALPRSVLVTSRGDSATGAKRTHYALLCHSDMPLVLDREGPKFHAQAYRNAGGTGAPVGASQVTALLRRIDADQGPTDYAINLSAWLTESYWVRLTDPVQLTEAKLRMLNRIQDQTGEADWLDLVDGLRTGASIEAAGLLL